MKLSWINGYCPDSVLSFYSLSWFFWVLPRFLTRFVSPHVSCSSASPAIPWYSLGLHSWQIYLWRSRIAILGGGQNPNPKANKQTETAQLSKIMQRIKSNLWGSVQAHAETQAGSECLCDREPEREEALKLKLLLQLCICSESLVWLTLTVFTLASAQMEQLWQQKQVILLITCCSRQLHQDPFLRAQMKQRRLYWALLLLLVLLSQGKNACLFKYVPKGIWSLWSLNYCCCYPQRMLIFGAALLQSFVWAVCCAIWRIIWLMGSVCPRKQNNYFLIHWCYVRHGSHVKDRRPLLKKQCC